MYFCFDPNMFSAAGSSLAALQVSLSEFITELQCQRWNKFVFQIEDHRHFTTLKRFVCNSGSCLLYSPSSCVRVMWHVLKWETVELFASGLELAPWTVPQGDSSENSWVEKHVGYVHKVGVFDEGGVRGPDIINPGLYVIRTAIEKCPKWTLDCLQPFRTVRGP